MTALERIFEAIQAKTKELGYNLTPVPNNVRTFGEGLHNLAPGIWEGLYLDPSKGMLVLLVNTCDPTIHVQMFKQYQNFIIPEGDWKNATV